MTNPASNAIDRARLRLLTLACALLLTLTLACAPQPSENADAAADPPAPADDHAASSTEAADHDDDHHDIGALPLPKRLAFMSGHVEAGLALYRAGEPEMAAPHLLHPVSETHAAERAGLDAFGFDGALFEAVSQALEAGQPAETIEPQLAAAEANLAMVTEKAGGDPKDIILYLMDTALEEYRIGVPGATVTDANEYHDAFGFVVVALQRATVFEGEAGDRLRAALRDLRALWPEGAPIPPENPTPSDEIERGIAQVRSAVAALG
ncbi:MAG: hypothetical protein AAF772_11345 [Acidobacteriota bacterium]